MSNILREFKKSGFNYLTNLIYSSDNFLIHYRVNINYFYILITSFDGKNLRFTNIQDNEYCMKQNNNDLIDFFIKCRIFKKEFFKITRLYSNNIDHLIDNELDKSITDKLIKEYLEQLIINIR